MMTVVELQELQDQEHRRFLVALTVSAAALTAMLIRIARPEFGAIFGVELGRPLFRPARGRTLTSP